MGARTRHPMQDLQGTGEVELGQVRKEDEADVHDACEWCARKPAAWQGGRWIVEGLRAAEIQEW